MNEWIEVQPPAKLGKLTEAGIVKPGTLIVVADESGETEELLIGDINTNGGICDCCDDVGRRLIVRYQQVWDRA